MEGGGRDWCQGMVKALCEVGVQWWGLESGLDEERKCLIMSKKLREGRERLSFSRVIPCFLIREGC